MSDEADALDWWCLGALEPGEICPSVSTLSVAKQAPVSLLVQRDRGQRH